MTIFNFFIFTDIGFSPWRFHLEQSQATKTGTATFFPVKSAISTFARPRAVFASGMSPIIIVPPGVSFSRPRLNSWSNTSNAKSVRSRHCPSKPIMISFVSVMEFTYSLQATIVPPRRVNPPPLLKWGGNGLARRNIRDHEHLQGIGRRRCCRDAIRRVQVPSIRPAPRPFSRNFLFQFLTDGQRTPDRPRMQGPVEYSVLAVSTDHGRWQSYVSGESQRPKLPLS